MTEKYQYKESGLDYVWLVNGFERVETKWGSGIRIENAKGLHEAIGKYIIEFDRPMSGNEIRFLRESMDLSQADLGKLLGFKDNQTVLQVEQGKGKFRNAMEATLRELYRQSVAFPEALNFQTVLKCLSTYKRTSVTNIASLELEEIDNSWLFTSSSQFQSDDLRYCQ